MRSSYEAYAMFEKQANALKESLQRIGRSTRDFKENRKTLNSLVEDQVRDGDLLRVSPHFNEELFGAMTERKKQIDSLKKDVAIGSGVRHVAPATLGTGAAIGIGHEVAKKKTKMNDVDQMIMEQGETGTVYES